MKTYRVTVDDVNVYTYETVQAKSKNQAIDKVLKPIWDVLSYSPRVYVEQV